MIRRAATMASPLPCRLLHTISCRDPIIIYNILIFRNLSTNNPIVDLGGGNDKFYSLNGNNGTVNWNTALGSSPDNFIWSAPAVYNGNIYIGQASFGDCPLTQGQLFQLDASRGAIQKVFNTVPSGCVGGGVWGSPTVDEAAGTIYFATGNPTSSCTSALYGVS
jgi:outer membrane protein assembly factor BamB